MSEHAYVSLDELLGPQPGQPEAAPPVELRISPLITSEEVHGQDVVIGQHEPILTTEQVTAQIAPRLGELAAVIELPGREFEPWVPEYYRPPEAVYIFRQRSAGKHRPSNYLLATKEQLALVHQAETTGEPDLAAAMRGIARLEPGQKGHRIGRAHWLPAVGGHVALVRENPELQGRYETVSHQHAELFVDPSGKLHLSDTSHNGTTVRENH